MAKYIYGVDVHPDYQRGLHFPTLYAQGYRYGMVKLTQGTGYRHDQSDEWVSGMRSAGLVAGGYHWLDNSNGAAQARWFWRRVKECGGPVGLIAMLDVEDTGVGPHMTAWALEWAQLSGGKPFCIYSGAWWWPRTGGFRGANLTPYLWHSHYLDADTDTLPDDPDVYGRRIPDSWWKPGYGGWSAATFLQFTSRGDAGRLGNKVDLNATKLTMAQIRALAGLGPVGAPGETGGGFVPIADGVTTPPAQQGVDEVLRIVKQQGTSNYWVSNMLWRKPFDEKDLDSVKYLLKEKFGQTNLQVEEPARLDLYGDETTPLDLVAERQQVDAYRLDALVFNRPATVGPEGSEYSGQANALHDALEGLKSKGGVTDADLAKVTEAVRAAVQAGVAAVLSGASVDVTGTLEVKPPTAT